MRIAVIGVGSIGIVVVRLMAKNGGDIEFIDSYAEKVKALNENGARNDMVIAIVKLEEACGCVNDNITESKQFAVLHAAMPNIK